MQPFTLNIDGGLVLFNRPVVMAIVNVTPDSFYPESRSLDADSLESRVRRLADRRVDMIDIGACSTRPGSIPVSVNEEIERLRRGMDVIKRVAPDALVSVDTFRAQVADVAVRELGCHIVNDVSGGRLDEDMFRTVAALGVPYVLTHSRGNSADMDKMAVYEDVTAEVVQELAEKLRQLRLLGVKDVIIDPGFGFAKTAEQNFRLIRDLEVFGVLHCPVLVGVSRKRLVSQTVGADAAHALNATTAVHMACLERGAAILRVHDVLQAQECIKIYNAIHQ